MLVVDSEFTRHVDELIEAKNWEQIELLIDTVSSTYGVDKLTDVAMVLLNKVKEYDCTIDKFASGE